MSRVLSVRSGGSWIRPVMSVVVVLSLMGLMLGTNGRWASAQDDGNQAGDASVRIVHGSPDAGAVDVYLDGEVVVEGVVFPSFTDPVFVAEGDHQIQIVPAGGALEDAVVDETETFTAGTAFLVAAYGPVDELQVAVNEVDLEGMADGQARLRVLHGTPDIGTVDVAIADGDNLVSNLEYQNLGRYVDLDADTYDLEVRASGGDSSTLTISDVTLEAGTVYDLFLVGSADDDSLQVLTVTTVPEEQQVAGYPAELRAGDCASPGDVVQSLNNLTIPEGDALGQADLATIAASSFSTADVSLETILGADHVIVVHESEVELGTAIACGEIGGAVTENGNLAVGLREVDGSGFAGIAYLETGTDGADATGIYVFLAEGLTSGAVPAEESPSGTPVAEG